MTNARDDKRSKPLPYFRRQVEELFEDTPAEKDVDDQQSNCVSFLVKNVKEIFSDENDKDFIAALESSDDILDDISAKHRYDPDDILAKNSLYKVNNPESSLDMIPRATLTEDYMIYENMSISPFPFLLARKHDNSITHKSDLIDTATEILLERIESHVVTNDKALIEELDTGKKLHERTFEERDIGRYFGGAANNETEKEKLSCIFCNNVETEDCGNPLNKLIPSIICANETDVCYSQHTPFGIVERGCFNVQSNLTVYACACNLCNHLSIAEMPMTYAMKGDWIEDVIEISNSRRLKKSVFRDTSCLSCEISNSRASTSGFGRACLEGDITSLSSVKCSENEVCGVKSVRDKGYVWRGCLKSPLYNYWLVLCDKDLCNHDLTVSLYDQV